MRLSVFAGSFSLKAAEAVCGAAVDVLEQLVDSSLVQPAGLGRFRMLDTVRRRQRSASRSREPPVRRGSTMPSSSSRTRRSRTDAAGAGAGEALAALALELDNFRTTLAFAQEHGLVELQLRVTRALHRFAYLRGT